MPRVGSIPVEVQSFLDFCRIEKGLAENSLEAYGSDLNRFAAACRPDAGQDFPSAEAIAQYLQSLYQQGLGSRSVARHLTTLRNFVAHLLREGRLAADPTASLALPRQWKNLPKFLNHSEIDRLLQAPDPAKPTGLRDRAMIELLY